MSAEAREAILAEALRVHDLRFGKDHCDRKYIMSCRELPSIILGPPGDSRGDPVRPVPND